MKLQGMLILFLSTIATMALAASDHSNNNNGLIVVTAGNAGYEYVVLNKDSSAVKIAARRASGIDQPAIQQAEYLQRKFGVIAKPTPLVTNKNINLFAIELLGHDIVIYMKDETTNPTGSFKDRMPIKFYQAISNDVAEVQKDLASTNKYDLKVIAVSTGNHGRAVAYAANVANDYINKQGLQNNFHIYSEITMTSDAMPHKKNAIAK